MKHFAVTIIVIIIVVAVIAYIETGLILPKNPIITSTQITTGQASTTILNATTSINRGQLYPCVDTELSENTSNTVTLAHCLLTSNAIGIWMAAGNSGSIHLLMTGPDNKTYINQTVTYGCTTFFTNFTGPKQVYNITVTTGLGGGSCGSSIVKFNSTTAPPQQVYDFVYNGNFSNGQYTGWNATGAGFGTSPLNLTYANNDIVKCYLDSPWSNMPGTYVASTYRCGTQTSPGSLTSSPFVVTEPFLNFRISSKPRGNLYVEIMYNNETAILAAYNTFNLSLPNSIIKTTINGAAGNANKTTTTSIFRNASIPLTALAGKVVRIRLVSSAVGTNYFMLAGGFHLSGIPNQQPGILINLTIYNTT